MIVTMNTAKKYLVPESLDEALNYARENAADFKYLAGGTDLMANRFHEHETSNCLIDIAQIPELQEVREDEEQLLIGSLVKLNDLQKIPMVAKKFPALLDAANAVGSPIIRKTATIGGNLLCENRCIYYNQSAWWRKSAGFCLKCGGEICIATRGKKACFSEIVSDLAPVLISFAAELALVDVAGHSRIKLEDLYTGDGVNPRNISKTAIITAIILPLSRDFKAIFKKLRQRQSLEFTSLTTAVAVDNTNKVKIAVGGVDPKVVVVEGTAGDDKAALIARCLKGARAVNNDMFSRDYRRSMIENYLTGSFRQLGI